MNRSIARRDCGKPDNQKKTFALPS
jgi:hypothetical protein